LTALSRAYLCATIALACQFTLTIDVAVSATSRPVEIAPPNDAARRPDFKRTPGANDATEEFERSLVTRGGKKALSIGRQFKIGLETADRAKLDRALHDAEESGVVAAILAIALEELQKHSDTEYADIANQPHLKLKRPANQLLDPLVSFVQKHKLDPLLAKSINPAEVLLMPFVYSSLGTKRIKDVSDHLVDSRIITHIENSGTDIQNTNLFGGLKNKTVVLIGHMPDAGSIEVRRSDSTVGTIALDQLQAFGRQHQFNLIVLACEAAKDAAVGPIDYIKDLDAIEGFQRAIRYRDMTTYGGFLAELSGPNLIIALDIARLSDNTDDIPIETLTGASVPYGLRGNVINTAFPAENVPSIAYEQPGITTSSPSSRKDSNSTVVQFIRDAFCLFSRNIITVFTIGTIISMIGIAWELMVLHRDSVGDAIVGTAAIGIIASFWSLCSILFLGSLFDAPDPRQPALILVALGAAVVIAARQNFPTQRVVHRSALAFCVFNCLAVTIRLGTYFFLETSGSKFFSCS
jgi:hypothetical protein